MKICFSLSTVRNSFHPVNLEFPFIIGGGSGGEGGVGWQENFTYASYMGRRGSQKAHLLVQGERSGPKASVHLCTYFMEDPS